MADSIKTYEPDNCLKNGILSTLKEIITELGSNKWLTLQMFRRDFFAMYKQSLIGVSWAFLIPIVSVGTFILLNQSGVFKIGEINVPYPIYAVLGMAFWQIFAIGLLASTNSLVKVGSMIVKINFSRKSLVIAAWAQFLIPFLVQVVLVAGLFFYFKVSPNIKILFVPLAIIPLLLFTLGLGFILALINAVLRDIGNVISILITFFMFLTPGWKVSERKRWGRERIMKMIAMRV